MGKSTPGPINGISSLKNFGNEVMGSFDPAKIFGGGNVLNNMFNPDKGPTNALNRFSHDIGFQNSTNGTTLNDLLQQWGTQRDDINNRLQPNSRNAAVVAGVGNQVADMARMRAQSRTNFTGGQGVLDSPSTASSVLLGS